MLSKICKDREPKKKCKDNTGKVTSSIAKNHLQQDIAPTHMLCHYVGVDFF
jgi:hypothetical protein